MCSPRRRWQGHAHAPTWRSPTQHLPVHPSHRPQRHPWCACAPALPGSLSACLCAHPPVLIRPRARPSGVTALVTADDAVEARTDPRAAGLPEPIQHKHSLRSIIIFARGGGGAVQDAVGCPHTQSGTYRCASRPSRDLHARRFRQTSSTSTTSTRSYGSAAVRGGRFAAASLGTASAWPQLGQLGYGPARARICHRWGRQVRSACYNEHNAIGIHTLPSSPRRSVGAHALPPRRTRTRALPRTVP